MNKRILSILMSLFILSAALALPASADAGVLVPYDIKSITIETTLDAPEGTPVTIIVAKPDSTGTATPEATLSALKAANSAQFLALVEHFAVGTTDADGAFTQSISLNYEEIAEGTCYVYLSYLNNDLYYYGYFESILKAVIDDMVEDFNETSANEYGTLFTEENRGYLAAFGADLEAYDDITDTSDFYSYLISKRPFVDNAEAGTTAIVNLITAFNDGVAFITLGETDDVLGTLDKYNDNIWSVDLSEGSDFDNLSSDGQTRVLSLIGSGGYRDSETLEADFAAQIGVSAFLDCTDEDVLMLALEKYNESVYGLDLTLLENEAFTEYHITTIWNTVLDRRQYIDSVEDMQEEYADAVADMLEEVTGEDDDDDDNRGSNRGGSVSYLPPLSAVQPEAMPVPTFFIDVPAKHWAYENIKSLYDKKIVSGRSATEFAPNDPVKREEFTKLMVSALGLSLTGDKVSFGDVTDGSWYQSYVSAAVHAELINGMGENTFGVGKSLTREDAAVIIDRALSAKFADSETKELTFVDKDSISDYAAAAVSRMVSNGLIQGNTDNAFLPKNEISRAEVCALLARMLEVMEGVESNA